MPLLLARTWQTLRGAPVIIGASNCARRPLQRAFTTSLHSASQTARVETENVQSRTPLNAAIIIPNPVINTQSADLINFIQPVKTDDFATQSFCVFFVTPSFAGWLQDESFLPTALGRLYRELWNTTSEPNPELHVLCAVVDKLPVGRAFDPNKILRDKVQQRTVEPPVSEIGSEGMAYVTLPAAASIPSTTVHSSDVGTIDFISAEYLLDQKCMTHIVRLPLANTIFQTGTVSTMTFSTWRTTNETSKLELLSKSKVSHHGVRIMEHASASGYLKSVLSIPLLPVSEPRRVDGCMGNIVRRVLDADGKCVTASLALEQVVPRFFKSLGQAPHSTTAWALIIPQSTSESASNRTKQLLERSRSKTEERDVKQDDPWDQLWQNSPPLWNDLVPTALAKGARLHRVLSGGGGWGKKAGLISLDPTPTRLDEHLSSEESPGLLKDPEDFASALTPVIEDGDSIQFFLFPISTTDTENDRKGSNETLMDLPKTNNWEWELGTIPSAVDSMPSTTAQDENPTAKSVSTFQNTFGALSEKGLTLTSQFTRQGEQVTAPASTTVIDVPFSRFSVVEVSKVPKSNADAKRISKNEGYFQVRYVAKDKEPLLIPAHTLTKHDHISRTLVNQVRRSGTKIARLTLEYKAVMFDLRQGQAIRSIPSGPNLTEASVSSLSSDANPSSKSKSTQTVPSSIASNMNLKKSKARETSGLHNPIKRILSTNTASQTEPDESSSPSLANDDRVSIRKIDASLAFEQRTIYATIVRTTLYISNLTEQYRTIMHDIRQRERRMKKFMTLSQRQILCNPLRKHDDVPVLLDTLSQMTASAEHFLSTLQRDLSALLASHLPQSSSTSPRLHTTAPRATATSIAAQARNSHKIKIPITKHAHPSQKRSPLPSPHRPQLPQKPQPSHLVTLENNLKFILSAPTPRTSQQRALEPNFLTNDLRHRLSRNLERGMKFVHMVVRKLRRWRRKKVLRANLRATGRGVEVRRVRIKLPVPVLVRRSSSSSSNSKVGGRRRRRMMVRRVGVELRGERARFWARRMQEERLVERVGGWLDPNPNGTAEGDGAKIGADLGQAGERVFGKRVFGQGYSVVSEDLGLSEGEEKKDGLELLMETARKQESRLPGRKRKR